MWLHFPCFLGAMHCDEVFLQTSCLPLCVSRCHSAVCQYQLCNRGSFLAAVPVASDWYVDQQLQVLSVYSGFPCALLEVYLLICFGCGFSCGQVKTIGAVAAVDVMLSEHEEVDLCQVH